MIIFGRGHEWREVCKGCSVLHCLFCTDRLLEFEILDRTKCWLDVSIHFSGSGVFCFLKYGHNTEVVELSTETAFISRAGLFSFCCGNTVAVLSRPSLNQRTL